MWSVGKGRGLLVDSGAAKAILTCATHMQRNDTVGLTSGILWKFTLVRRTRGRRVIRSGVDAADAAVPRAERAAEADGGVHGVAADPAEHYRLSVHDDARERDGKGGSEGGVENDRGLPTAAGTTAAV